MTREQVASFFDWVQEQINDAQEQHVSDTHYWGQCTDEDDHIALYEHYGKVFDAVIAECGSLVNRLPYSPRSKRDGLAWFIDRGVV